MHMMWNAGMGSTPWMWLVMGGGTVAFWVAVVFAARCAFGGPDPSLTNARGSGVAEAAPPPRREGHPSRAAAPLEVLQGRLALGEIDVDEYARVRKALVERDPTLGRDCTRSTPT